MNKKQSLANVLNMQPKQKSRLLQMIEKLHYYFWLHLIIRKKSHRVRIIKAMRVFNLLKKPEFTLQPSRFFAYIRTIDPFVFEELILIAFKSRGLKVIHNKRYTGDGGIDGMVELPTKQRIALQAKRYKNHINLQHLINFSQTVRTHGCSKGYFIHCGKKWSGNISKFTRKHHIN